MTTKNDAPAPAGIEPISFEEFLLNIPPSQMQRVGDLAIKKSYSTGSHVFEIQVPDILIHCSNKLCSGPRIHRTREGSFVTVRKMGVSEDVLIKFVCSNCKEQTKWYSLVITLCTSPGFPGIEGDCYKFGELPPFGSITSEKLLKLMGSHRSLFLKGRQCENQGLGVGAFAYYRRVVESQKDKILSEIVKVAEKLNLLPETIEILNRAKAETRFTEALSLAKDAIPEALFIDGMNPLALLHSALSDGLHDRSDEHCLDAAHAVRLVLAELSERMARTLKENAELSQAVNRLRNARGAADKG